MKLQLTDISKREELCGQSVKSWTFELCNAFWEALPLRMHLKILKELKYLHQICLYIMFFGLELDIISNMTYSSLSSAITSERLFSHNVGNLDSFLLSWRPNIHPWLFALFAEGSSCYINMWSKVWSTVCKGGSCNQSLTHNYIWITLRFLFTNLFFWEMSSMQIANLLLA